MSALTLSTRTDSEKSRNEANLQPVLEGLAAAKAVGMDPIKVNAVIIRGFNDDELLDLVEFGRHHHFEMRLIEYMDVGNASGWTSTRRSPNAKCWRPSMRAFRSVKWEERQAALPQWTTNSSTGRDRSASSGLLPNHSAAAARELGLTADGKFVTCLFAETGIDLKTRMRQGAPDEELSEIIRTVWSNRADRYSDLRWERLKSGSGYEPRAHKKIEMITLGG